MKYTKDSSKFLKIEDVYYPFLVEYKVGNEPLMSSDTGRTIQTGEMKGRLVGIFPKIYLKFNIPDDVAVADIKPLFQTLVWNKNIKVDYFNPATDTIVTGYFYANTLDLEMLPDNYLGEFSINLISNKRLE